ncbi:TPA: hypothetical protein ACSTJZ_003158 [Serratia fonticola]|uniref:hypothetical protein n=1 Tax=Serratia fonticola TaxID=47917 RepID=UPI0034C5D59A
MPIEQLKVMLKAGGRFELHSKEGGEIILARVIRDDEYVASFPVLVQLLIEAGWTMTKE